MLWIILSNVIVLTPSTIGLVVFLSASRDKNNGDIKENIGLLLMGLGIILFVLSCIISKLICY